MRIPTILMTALLMALAPAAVRAQGDQGVTTANTIALGRGARAVSLGGAYMALADGAESIVWNPAGMTSLRDTQVSFSHMAYLGGINDEFLAMARPIYGMGAWGLGTSYLYANDTRRDNWGNDQGTFTTFDFQAMAALALEFRPLSFGVNYRIIRQGYDYAFAMGSAFNFGVQARGLLDNRLNIGLGGRNFGTPMPMGSEYYQLPMTWQAGASWALLPGWDLAVDFSHQPIEFINKWHFGTEYRLPIGSDQSVALRAGYTDGPERVLGGMTGVSAGLGYGLRAWQLDYAVNSLGDLGLSHRISLSYHFGQD